MIACHQMGVPGLLSLRYLLMVEHLMVEQQSVSSQSHAGPIGQNQYSTPNQNRRLYCHRRNVFYFEN